MLPLNKFCALDIRQLSNTLKYQYIFTEALGGLVYSENGVSFDGNQGIKDQQLALKWVYDNIENFGGNKSEVSMVMTRQKRGRDWVY